MLRVDPSSFPGDDGLDEEEVFSLFGTRRVGGGTELRAGRGPDGAEAWVVEGIFPGRGTRGLGPPPLQNPLSSLP